MKEFFTNLLSRFQNSHKRPQPSSRDRRVRLSVETLEGRELPSASPMGLAVGGLGGAVHTVNPNVPPAYSYTQVNAAGHVQQILQQLYGPDLSATHS